MKIPFKLGDKTFYLNQYTTYQEKEILLLDSFDICDADAILNVLNFIEIGALSLNEKKLLLYKFREISLGDEVNISFVCEKCKQGNDGVIEACNFIVPPKRNDSDISKIFQEVTEDNLYLYTDIDLNELDILEYEKFKQRIIDNQSKINFVKTAKCLKCGTLKEFDLSSLKYIIEIMSDDTLMSLYKSYNNLIFFGHYSKEDIDGMYPFERNILEGLMNKSKEDLAKG